MLITSFVTFFAARRFDLRSHEDIESFVTAAPGAHFTDAQAELLRGVLFSLNHNADSYISSVTLTICSSMILIIIIPLFGYILNRSLNK